MAARSVPGCGAAGAHGWNIDYLTPGRASRSQVQPGEGPVRGLREWNAVGVRVGV